MNNQLSLSGMVLYSVPAGDFDKRVVLLTKERGKITAFARGARRAKSTLNALVRPFACGTFELYEGRSAYTLAGATIWDYFSQLSMDLESSLYGSYFLELSSYYARENLESSGMLNLLYVTLKALEKKELDNRLIRCIFEIRLMVLNGEYPQEVQYDPQLGSAAAYAVNCAISQPLKTLYSFTVPEEALQQLIRLQNRIRAQIVDRPIKSLEVLESILGPM